MFVVRQVRQFVDPVLDSLHVLDQINLNGSNLFTIFIDLYRRDDALNYFWYRLVLEILDPTDVERKR